MSLDDKFLLINQKCSCIDQPPRLIDGYAIVRERCLQCHGRGVKTSEISLAELKAWLDGYSG
jgi:hypothetical protein